MPTHLSCRTLIPVLIGAFALTLSLAGPVQAKSSKHAKPSKTVPAELRVVDSTGKTLAHQTQYTTDATLRADRGATCFGDGTAGSGARIELPGPTALGQVIYGAKLFRALRPVSVTDAFSFGPGICGIGKAVSPSTGFWYIKQNHESSMVGADQIELTKRDSILWYLIDDFNQPTPDELGLRVAKKVRDGELAVRVSSYSDDGSKSPAAGATVSGASEPTDEAGRTTVTLGGGKVTAIQATREGSIPSTIERVCGAMPKQCPYGYASTIGGTSKADKIKGSAAAETILAGGGKDRIRVPRGKQPVKVDCGPGKDMLRVAKSRKAKVKSCEKVRRTKR